MIDAPWPHFKVVWVQTRPPNGAFSHSNDIHPYHTHLHTQPIPRTKSRPRSKREDCPSRTSCHLRAHTTCQWGTQPWESKKSRTWARQVQ